MLRRGAHQALIGLPVGAGVLHHDLGAGLVAGHAVGAGGHRIDGHLVRGGLIGGLGDDRALHQQGVQVAGGQLLEVEAADVVAEHLDALDGGELGQVADGLRGLVAELDVAGGQRVAGLIDDVVVELHVVGEVIDLGQLLHQDAGIAVAVLGDEELIGGEQDADAAGAHALERADVAGIAGDTDDDGFTLLSRGGTQAQAAHEQRQREDQRQDLLHEGFLLVVF